MSTNVLPHLKDLLVDAIDRTSKLFISDLSHIPDDKLASSPMGCARSPLEFSAECAGFNGYVARILLGDPMATPTQEERDHFFSSMDTREKVVEALEASSHSLAEAIKASSDENLAREVTTPWGQPMPAYALVHIAGSHMSYHDGQLNYIQCLYGDSENHWV